MQIRSACALHLRHVLLMDNEYLALVVEQIARDTATLKMASMFVVPNRQFYIERIVAYRRLAQSLKGDSDTDGSE